MSSLNATQADGYYIPPDYVNSGAYKKKSLNQFNNNKGHNQYLTNSVVRFELPYDGFCLNEECGAHVGKGTRFNAHKAHVDDYFTTKIWEFTMKCRSCASSKFIIRTNPKGRCFDYCHGIKKKMEEFDTLDAGTLGIIDTEDGNKIQKSLKNSDNSDRHVSAIDKLQEELMGERKAIAEKDAIELLLKQNGKTMANDAISNSKLRSNYRTIRNAKKRRIGDANKKGLGMGIELSAPTKLDATIAKNTFSARTVIDAKSKKIEKQKFATIRTSSIFSDASSSGYNRSTNSSFSRSKRR